MYKNFIILVLFFLIGFLLGTTFKLALAWRNPSVAPPGGTEQAIQADETGNVTISNGKLTVSGGNLIVSGTNKAGIRQSSPASTLHVSGHVRIGDSGSRKGITLFEGAAAYCVYVTSSVLTTTSGICESVLGGE